MDRARLNALLETYGGDPARWPEAERAHALDMIAAEPELARAQKAASSLDRLLALAPAGKVDEALLTRILEAAPRPVARPLAPRESWLLEGLGRLIHLPPINGALASRPLAILALAICIGLGVGALLPSWVATQPSEVDMLSMMWGEPVFSQVGGES